MYSPRRNLPIRKTREDRYAEIMEYLFYCGQLGWKPSSYAIAKEIGLAPSQYVRGILQDLLECGIILMTEGILRNGRKVHNWEINIPQIETYHPVWKSHLIEKFKEWPTE